MSATIASISELNTNKNVSAKIQRKIIATLGQLQSFVTELINTLPENQRTLAKHETHELAIHLFKETERLRTSYNLLPLPIIHNFLIVVGLKKRGACKHWAEDLLESLKPMPRQYFKITWGEAKPFKPGEHNSLVIFPKNKNFENGYIFDPWRTAGKPFWRRVNADPHYPWRQWNGYGVY